MPSAQYGPSVVFVGIEDKYLARVRLNWVEVSARLIGGRQLTLRAWTILREILLPVKISRLVSTHPLRKIFATHMPFVILLQRRAGHRLLSHHVKLGL